MSYKIIKYQVHIEYVTLHQNSLSYEQGKTIILIKKRDQQIYDKDRHERV